MHTLNPVVQMLCTRGSTVTFVVRAGTEPAGPLHVPRQIENRSSRTRAHVMDERTSAD